MSPVLTLHLKKIYPIIKYSIILLSIILLIGIVAGMPPQTGINVTNRNAQEKIAGRVVDVNEAPVAWKNILGKDHLTYFTLRVVNVEATSSGIKKDNLIKLVGEYYIEPGADGIGISRQNLHKDDLIKVYANATLLRDEKGELVYMPVSGGYSIRPHDYEIPPAPPNQTTIEIGNKNSEEIIIGRPLVKGLSSEIETIVGDMPSDPLEQIHGDISQEIIAAWTLNKTEGIHRMPDTFLENISAIEPKWRNLTMLLYFNLKVEKVEKTSSGIKCGDIIKIAYIGYTYNNWGNEFYKLVNIKGKNALKIYANATSIRDNEGELFYMPIFGGDSIISQADIPQMTASIGGNVTDFEHKPVNNARLIFKINNEDIALKTDQNGRFALNNVEIGCVREFNVKIEADMYEPQVKNIIVKEGKNDVDFILTSKKQPVAGFEVVLGIAGVLAVWWRLNTKGK